MSRSLLRIGGVLLLLAAAVVPAAAGDADAVARLRKALDGKAPAPEKAEAARGLFGVDTKAAAEQVCRGFLSVSTRRSELAARRTASREEFLELVGDQEMSEQRAYPEKVKIRMQELRQEEEDLRWEDDREREVLEVLRDLLGDFRDWKAVAYLASVTGRSSTSPVLRVATLQALGEIADETTTKAVRAALKDRDPSIREAALGALALIRKEEEETLRDLAAGLEDDRWTVRLAAARRLADIGSPEAVDLLIPRLAVETGKPRADVAVLLRSLTGQRFGPEPEGWTHWWRENREAYVVGDMILTPGAPGPDSGADGPRGEANYYGITVESKRILFVIDISGSMSKPGTSSPDVPKVEDAKKELLRCIRSLEGESAFTVYAFHDTVSKWNPGLQPADAENRDAIAKWVGELGASSWTNTYAALEEAINASAANPKNNMGADYGMAADTIFLLTDGSPTTAGGKLRDSKGNAEYLRVLEAVRDWNREKRVAIHAIGVGPAINADFLSTLARENDGTFVTVR